MNATDRKLVTYAECPERLVSAATQQAVWAIMPKVRAYLGVPFKMVLWFGERAALERLGVRIDFSFEDVPLYGMTSAGGRLLMLHWKLSPAEAQHGICHELLHHNPVMKSEAKVRERSIRLHTLFGDAARCSHCQRARR
ncbi:MAG: hypothetical protein L0177_06205 [Chloroflexi bacterium]|nr:hypothetical protein [Chloroflexota bacterium]